VFDAWAPTYTAEVTIPLENPVLTFNATYSCAPYYHDQSLENQASQNGTPGELTPGDTPLVVNADA
jgi:hypothetical protein